MRRVQQSQGWSYAEAAKTTGLSEKTCRRYCDINDPTVPGLISMARVCQKHGLSMDQIVFGGGFLSDDDIERRWSRTMSWWTHRLSEKQKRLVLDLMAVVWEEALKHKEKNPEVEPEIIDILLRQPIK